MRFVKPTMRGKSCRATESTASHGDLLAQAEEAVNTSRVALKRSGTVLVIAAGLPGERGEAP